MPRNRRCVLPSEAYHITQRGTNRQRVFFKDADRSTYLRLMAPNLADAGVRVLAWCLMGNHVYLVAVAEQNDSRSVLLWRVHGRYAQIRCSRSRVERSGSGGGEQKSDIKRESSESGRADWCFGQNRQPLASG